MSANCMRKLILFACCLLFLQAKAQNIQRYIDSMNIVPAVDPDLPTLGIDSTSNGYVEVKYPDGKIWFQLNLINGVCNGEQKSFYESGALKYHEFYVNGIADSTSSSYDEAGFPVSNLNFKAGIRHGIQQIYNEKGIKILEELYDEGILRRTTIWNDDGSFFTETTY